MRFVAACEHGSAATCMHSISPVTLNSCRQPLGDWMTASRATLIWLVVSVPVLSEQITVVQPSVSTDGRLQSSDLGMELYFGHEEEV